MANKQNTLSLKVLQFNSLLTGDARSAILAGDPTTNIHVPLKYLTRCEGSDYIENHC